MFDIGYIDSDGKAHHAILDYFCDDDLINILYSIQDDLGCEVFSIRSVDLEERES